MKIKDKFLRITGAIFFFFLLVLIVIAPEICKNAAVNGILLCGRVIIPSLFPFTACILFIMKSGVTAYLNKFSFLTRKIFGLQPHLICIVFLSFLGGYPVGARLLNEAVADKKITPKAAGKMLNYCVNAGPAFIVAAVGSGILGSKKTGYILLASHLLASVIMMLLLRDNYHTEATSIPKPKSISDCFVAAAADASAANISICSFVIFFSVITAYAEHFATAFKPLRYITYILEITTAIPKTGNIYLISFLLGFSGLCVWCQIFSMSKNIKINFPQFVFFRLLHGALSYILTTAIVKLFGTTAACITNNVSFLSDTFYSTPALSVSLIIMGLLFLISLFSKKHTGKFLDDVV